LPETTYCAFYTIDIVAYVGVCNPIDFLTAAAVENSVSGVYNNIELFTDDVVTTS